MRALIYESYGGPDKLSVRDDLPEPRPAAGAIRIRTRAAGLNPVDALQREGTFRALDPYQFPIIGGNELSGVVESVGPDTSRFTPGDQVIAKTDIGAFAEVVSVDETSVAAAPTTVPLVDAAGLPLAGLTAQQAFAPDHLDLQAGDRLLITGGAGGVGLLAIQLAKLRGAEVTTTASERGSELVRSMGADHVIDYHKYSVADGKARFDKVLDLVGGDEQLDLFDAIKPGGRVVTLAGPPTPGSLSAVTRPSRKPLAAAVSRLRSCRVRRMAKRAKTQFEFFLMHPDGAGLAELVSLIDDGKLILPIDSRYPLHQYKDAFERLESRRSKGKVVLEF